MDHLLALSWLLLGLLLVAVFLHHAQRARTLGRALAVERPGRLSVMLGTLLLLGVTILASQLAPELLSCDALPTVTLVLAVLWLAPRRATRACGSRGVQAGWYLVPLSGLVEWRLAGDHLRFRWDDTWRAVRIPTEVHAPLRAHLEDQAAGRESPFR